MLGIEAAKNWRPEDVAVGPVHHRAEGDGIRALALLRTAALVLRLVVVGHVHHRLLRHAEVRPGKESRRRFDRLLFFHARLLLALLVRHLLLGYDSKLADDARLLRHLDN